MIEELTLNAWPPLQSLLFDGWVLGFSHGYTRRANSVQVLYPSSLPLDEKIATCEQTYAARERTITFKLTSSPADPSLDDRLADRGYDRIAPTSVQTADLTRAALEADPSVALATALTDRWFAAFNRLSVTPEILQPYERALLEKIVPPHCFAYITSGDEIVAVGLAVVERAHVGLFDIIVDGQIRNQGLGRRLCTALLHWAHTQQQADTAYLAVMEGNAPALHLYARLGFREQYTYWYRQNPSP